MPENEGREMYQQRYTTAPDEVEAINLAEDKTLKGYGRRGHGLCGKDADLDGGQIVITEAWWFPEAVEATAYVYAIEPHESCDACDAGDCDGVEIVSPHITIRADADTEDEEEAIRILHDAIVAHPDITYWL